ncbi:MAG: hypothetical protein WCG95_04370 [bacterium]
MLERDYENFGDVIFYNAAEKNKKQALRYILLLTLTQGLRGNGLKEYLNNWNLTAKESKVSYQNLLKARKIFAKEGKLGLLQPLKGKRGVPICF